MSNSVKINGKDYLLADLSELAQSLLRNFNIAEARLGQLRQDAAMLQLARDAYGEGLLKNLPPQGAAPTPAPAASR